MQKPTLTIDQLRAKAAEFAEIESTYPEPSLYGVDNGKSIGTYLEQKFTAHLSSKYELTFRLFLRSQDAVHSQFESEVPYSDEMLGIYSKLVITRSLCRRAINSEQLF